MGGIAVSGPSPSRFVAALAAALFASLPLAASRADEGVDLGTPEAVQKGLESPETGVRLAAANVAKGMQDALLTAPLLRAAKDDALEVRQAAVDALAKRTAPKEKKAAARGLAALLRPLPREPSDEDLAREALLVPALHDLAEKVSIQALLDVHGEAPIAQIRARLMAVGNVPAAEAIEALIAYGARRRAGDGHRAAVRAALEYATGETKIGSDPDAWRAWWRGAKDRFDFQAAAARRAEAREKKADASSRHGGRRHHSGGQGDGGGDGAGSGDDSSS